MKEKCSAFYDIPFNRDIAWVMASLRNNFTLVPEHLYLNLDGMIRSKAHQAIYDLLASGNVDVGLKYYRQVGVSLVYRFGGYKDKSKEVDTARFKQ